MALVSVQWVLIGYSLGFGTDINHIMGSLNWMGLNGVSSLPNETYAATIPHQLFIIFQLMFAIITVALITGAFAERMKFTMFIAFVLFRIRSSGPLGMGAGRLVARVGSA